MTQKTQQLKRKRNGGNLLFAFSSIIPFETWKDLYLRQIEVHVPLLKS